MNRLLRLRDRARAWLRRPVAGGIPAVLTLLLCLAPGWLFWDDLQSARLRGDDFSYLSDCRGGAAPWDNLLTPHNAHVVPIFRLITIALVKAAGGLADVAVWFAFANYLALAGVMLGVGHLVAWETRSLAIGLLALTATGLTSVMFTAATWFSAGQTLWVALAVVTALTALQRWRITRSRVWVAVAFFAACLAPGLWAGGVVAGCAACAYLLAANDSDRRLAFACLAPSLLAILILIPVGLRASSAAEGASAPSPMIRVTAANAHLAQAVVESLVFQNLGIDAATYPAQAIALAASIAAVWVVSRLPKPVPNTLEATGLVIMVVPYALAFSLRAGYDFNSLRTLDWYDVVPHVGFVLFLAGWLARRAVALPGKPERLSRGGFAAVAIFSAALLALHFPRIERLVIALAPEMTSSESKKFLIPDLQRRRAVYWQSELSARQHRALVRLERAARLAAREEIARDTIRRRLGPILVPGWPKTLQTLDALDLVPLLDRGGRPLDPRTLAELQRELAFEPPPRPYWVAPEDPWPPPDPRHH